MEEGAWKKREQRVHAGSLLTDILLEYNRVLWSQSFAKEAANFFFWMVMCSAKDWGSMNIKQGKKRCIQGFLKISGYAS